MMATNYSYNYHDVSGFQQHLPVDLQSNNCGFGWVFWRPLESSAADEELDNIRPSEPPISSGGELREKIKCLLEKMESSPFTTSPCLVQFWAPEVIDQHRYLTTAYQPFVVERLCKGLSLYRRRCMGHRFRVDEGAREEELGVVGRVYRNKQPESTPELGLYSSEEFPLRDDAVRCGLRSLLALPVFDLRKEKFYGVIEVLNRDCEDIFMVKYLLEGGLKAAELRTTHQNLDCYKTKSRIIDVDREITAMLESAIRVMPQLQMAQVWVPCKECSTTSNNMSCMERATFVSSGDGKVNSWTNIDNDMRNYLKACELHNLHVGKYTNIVSAVMSSNNKSCICRNICDFSITEHPLAHYAQKARLSFCFAICLESLYDYRDICVVEFCLQSNSRDDYFFGSILQFLIRIMKMELKKFEFAYKGQQGEELVVEVYKGNKISSDESSQFNALRNEFLKYKHQHSEEPSELMVTKGFKRVYQLSDFLQYLEKTDLHSEKSTRGWVFWNQARAELLPDEFDCISSLLPNPIQEKIKLFMREIISKSAAYSLAQFWAPKVDADRCKLETLGQPFALGSLHQGLAYFRKQYMEHYYFVDEGAKEDELGPPGRVFLNGHPEFTPDLRLYSTTEFPLRNHAAHCYLRKYLALPVFDLNQLKCVGVLELLEFSKSALEVIGKALEAAKLSSTHINFKPRFLRSYQPINDFKCRRLALNEIQEANSLFKVIPHLYMVEVWVSYSKCPRKSDTLSCMERVWATRNIMEFDLPMCPIQHIEIGKGIIGMTLASENRSCFCGNLGGFSIADQPLAHYAQPDRLDVCFAICLQSQYTGDLLYVLEFYLNQGPRGYEYLRSFLCLLLPVMKQKLKSFKVASGQQLGESLVVEVIGFSEVNEFAFSEINHPDECFPFTFKYVKYRSQKHSKDKQVQFSLEESVTSNAQEELGNSSASSLKENDAAEKMKDGKRETHLSFSFKDLESHSGQKRKDAENALGISELTLKRRCTEYGMQMLPRIEKHKENPSLFVRERVNEKSVDLSHSDIPHDQNVPLSDPKSSQDLIVQPKVDMVVIYAKYESKTIKLKLRNSTGMEKLVNEVATRLKLKVGSFELEYLDEINEKIVLTCDSDLELCLESLAALHKPYIELFVRSV